VCARFSAPLYASPSICSTRFMMGSLLMSYGESFEGISRTMGMGALRVWGERGERGEGGGPFWVSGFLPSGRTHLCAVMVARIWLAMGWLMMISPTSPRSTNLRKVDSMVSRVVSAKGKKWGEDRQ
jgi:hypothetical protein